MMTMTPDKEWWTASEVSEAALQDLPSTQQGVDALAKSLDWRAHPDFARRRAGRGGGWEYHWRLFPSRAQRQLLAAATTSVAAPKQREDRAEIWAWFDGLPESVKAKARSSLRALQEVEALSQATTKYLAVSMIATKIGKSDRTVWNWFEKVEGVDPADWLPHLAPRHRAVSSKGRKSKASQEFYDWLKADFLRLEGPAFRSCYRRIFKLCEANGLTTLTERTAQRWMDEAVPYVSQVYMREGVSGLAKCFPPQIRDRTGMTALEGVNADCHKIDVFVEWPGFEKPIRPQIVAFQDLYSGKILSWRVDVDPNKVAVMGAFTDLLKMWGIPKHCLFDNGREFANKWLTGGAPTRFRFKVREDEPLGVLALLGVKIHWATPAHGQAKPVERAFGDFARDIAKDPRFAGAYVGNRPDAKPENYMSRAIELQEFLDVVAEGIIEHNARQGRLSENANGRSFDDTFVESYERSPVRKATEAQTRLCLMAQEVRKLNRNHGQMMLHKNGYWSEWMSEIAGEEIVARFNPENLHEGVHIYSLAGEFLGYAECRQKSGFFDLASARATAKDNARRMREQRRIAKDLRPVSVGGLAQELNKLPSRQDVSPESKVVKLAQMSEIERLEKRSKGGLLSRPTPTPTSSPEDDAKLLDFQQRHLAKQQGLDAEKREETARDRFFRALDLERRSEAGEPISEADARWFQRISQLPEYKTNRTFYDQYGAEAIR